MSPEELFEQNKRLVYYVCNKVLGSYGRDRAYIEKEDLHQIGFLGLWRACNNFKESFNTKFSTYAFPTILGEILKELRDKTGDIKVPRQSKLLYKKILKKMDFGEERPTLEQVIKEYDTNEYYGQIALELLDFNISSLDVPVVHVDGRESSIVDLIRDEDIDLEFDVLRDLEFKERISILQPREQKIIKLMMLDYTQSEIGKIIGVSQVQVSRLYKMSLTKIKNHYEVIENENELQLT